MEKKVEKVLGYYPDKFYFWLSSLLVLVHQFVFRHHSLDNVLETSCAV